MGAILVIVHVLVDVIVDVHVLVDVGGFWFASKPLLPEDFCFRQMQ